MNSRRRNVSSHDYVALGTLHNGKQLLALRLGHLEFGHGVIKILAEGGPLSLRDLEVFVRFAHGTAGILLWATCCPTNHLGHIVFKACRADGDVLRQQQDSHSI